MATTNGDTKGETAETFARDYLEELFSSNKNLGAFEEETLDLNIKSKYDNILVEEEAENDHSHDHHEESKADNVASFTVEAVATNHQEADSSSSLAEEEAVQPEAPLEPGHETFQVHDSETHQVNGSEPHQVNGHAEHEVADEHEHEHVHEVASQNGDLHHDVPEPDQVEFISHSVDVIEPEVSQFHLQSEAPAVAQFEAPPEPTPEEEEEVDDVVAPIPSARAAPGQTSEEEEADLQFKKLGLSKNWWDSKRSESETQQDGDLPAPDKFRTIKQNIRKGNTRSLLARFENMSKLTE